MKRRRRRRGREDGGEVGRSPVAAISTAKEEVAVPVAETGEVVGRSWRRLATRWVEERGGGGGGRSVVV